MDILSILIGIVIGVAAMAFAIRRAKAKPDGKTAKVMLLIGGGQRDA